MYLYLSLFLFQLEPGDRILAVNGEDVKEAPRDHVIQLVRACDTQVSLLVCQPAMSGCPGRKSTLLSAGKRAKLRSRPSRVRFAESVCVNGAPLFPVSALNEIPNAWQITNSTQRINDSEGILVFIFFVHFTATLISITIMHHTIFSCHLSQIHYIHPYRPML